MVRWFWFLNSYQGSDYYLTKWLRVAVNQARVCWFEMPFKVFPHLRHQSNSFFSSNWMKNWKKKKTKIHERVISFHFLLFLFSFERVRNCIFKIFLNHIKLSVTGVIHLEIWIGAFRGAAQFFAKKKFFNSCPNCGRFVMKTNRIARSSGSKQEVDDYVVSGRNKFLPLNKFFILLKQIRFIIY